MAPLVPSSSRPCYRLADVAPDRRRRLGTGVRRDAPVTGAGTGSGTGSGTGADTDDGAPLTQERGAVVGGGQGSRPGGSIRPSPAPASPPPPLGGGTDGEGEGEGGGAVGEGDGSGSAGPVDTSIVTVLPGSA